MVSVITNACLRGRRFPLLGQFSLYSTSILSTIFYETIWLALMGVKKRIIWFTEFLILVFSVVVGFGERWNVRQQINPPKDLRSFSFFVLSFPTLHVTSNQPHAFGRAAGGYTHAIIHTIQRDKQAYLDNEYYAFETKNEFRSHRTHAQDHMMKTDATASDKLAEPPISIPRLIPRRIRGFANFHQRYPIIRGLRLPSLGVICRIS
ncbi:hypothetical protein F4680DRAFT_364633 [Xylaria scruposa]|nr:hypothetical protein F4680DRAFT_364633 [Xylaria scruposa]